MMRQPVNRTINGLALLLAGGFVVPAMAQSERLVGSAAFGDWRADKARLEPPDQGGRFAEAGGDALGRQCLSCGPAAAFVDAASASRI